MQKKLREDTVNPEIGQDDQTEASLRPEQLSQFIGQAKLKSNLDIFIGAAREREESLDHVLFYGPPGLGKTTLSQIIAKEMKVGFKMASGPVLTKAGELAAILTNLQEKDVFFIDEIHRLHPSVEEVLYSAMEDYSIDIVIGDGATARVMKIAIPNFTLVGATTKLGSLSNPLRDRFGIPMKLDFYSPEELKQVIERGVKLFGDEISEQASIKLAACSRGTPRIALRLLRRVRDFAHFKKEKVISEVTVEEALKNLGVDELGLDRLDYQYLHYIAESYRGGPVGIETLAAGLSEDKDTIEDTIEPYLMQVGFVSRTTRGRMLTDKALKYLNLPVSNTSEQGKLL